MKLVRGMLVHDHENVDAGVLTSVEGGGMQLYDNDSCEEGQSSVRPSTNLIPEVTPNQGGGEMGDFSTPAPRGAASSIYNQAWHILDLCAGKHVESQP